ncbi:Ion_trans domain-containing protein [Durusdinium trenchii]
MGPTVVFPGTHDDPYLQQWLSVMPSAQRTPEQFGGGSLATCPPGTALVMNSRLLHCGGANLLAGGSRRRLFYMTWQKPKNTNHGSTYSILDALAGRYDLRHVVRRTPTVEAIAEVDEERIALEISAKKKDDPQAMLDFALRLRQEGDPGAVEWLRATGRKGHPLACMHLAEMYCLGELGLETNYEAAEELRKFAFGLFSHLADRSETKPRLQEFLENHTEVFRQELLF